MTGDSLSEFSSRLSRHSRSAGDVTKLHSFLNLFPYWFDQVLPGSSIKSRTVPEVLLRNLNRSLSKKISDYGETARVFRTEQRVQILPPEFTPVKDQLIRISYW